MASSNDGLRDSNFTATEHPEREEEIHCFGMISGCSIDVSDGHTPIEIPAHLRLTNDSRELVHSSTGFVFGLIDQKLREILRVLDEQRITLQLFADEIVKASTTSSRRAFSGRLKGRSSGHLPQLELCVVLYGAASLSEAVGIFASKCHIYLQDPRYCDLNVPYNNPQSLSRKDDSKIYTFDLDQFSHSEKSSLMLSKNPIDLFADDKAHDRLADAITPSALSTELYKHQRQALTFMIQRECGWAMDSHHKDIWREQRDDQGQSWYQNTITGSQQLKTPRPFRGGLLIDAPGLGKSLSILALVASDAIGQDAKGEDSSTKASLIIVPKTLIQMWKDEIQKHMRSPEALTYCVYYGKDRFKYLDELDEFRLVITTYSIVRLDWKAWMADRKLQQNLYVINWERIILDEAHIIREPSKSFARSVCALEARKRWAVTGTPIQVSLKSSSELTECMESNLAGLFKFLRCSPFDDLRIFNVEVTENWKTRSDSISIAKLKALLSCLALRRSKKTIVLLPRKDEVKHLEFSDLEWEQYKLVKSKAASSIIHTTSTNPQDCNCVFSSALQLVNELRLICNHGTKMMERERGEPEVSPWTATAAQTRFDQLDGVGLAKCSNIGCRQDLSSAQSSEAGGEHEEEPWINDLLEVWCSSCYNQLTRKPRNAHRICNHVARQSTHPVPFSENNAARVGNDMSASMIPTIPIVRVNLPTKIQRLIKDLLETPDNLKSVVFSSWTRTLDIIQPQLHARSIRCVRLDGSLSSTSRANVLRVFRTNADIKVLLATITCGGVGIDLTAASRAYIMEPQWNPMSEAQALDRVHRLGQEKEVVTVRYFMKGSYEEQVLNLQERKADLAELTLTTEAISKVDLSFGRLQWLKELLA
ncbi:hypothetical protein ACLMJK_009506 [Lecanora helva]